jgi:glycosyltransferase involved in cell wall biosynthesis
MLRLVRRGRGGVVYLPLPQGAPAFLRESLLIHVAASVGWRVAVHLRGGEFHHFYGAQMRLLRWWIRVTMRRVDAVGVMGESLRSIFTGLVPPQRIAVVANGTPDLGPVPEVARERDLVLYFGNLRRRKGISEALTAAELVLERRPDARFVFAGDTTEPEVERELAQRAAASGGRIDVRPPTAGEEKRRLFLSAAVLLFPPVLPEGHPRVVLEGLAAGLPVVTTDRGAIAETVRDGVDGFVLSDPEPEALADRVLRLLDDDELRVRMGRAARERYLERYTQEAADRRLADWLASV